MLAKEAKPCCAGDGRKLDVFDRGDRTNKQIGGLLSHVWACASLAAEGRLCTSEARKGVSELRFVCPRSTESRGVIPDFGRKLVVVAKDEAC